MADSGFGAPTLQVGRQHAMYSYGIQSDVAADAYTAADADARCVLGLKTKANPKQENQ